MLASSAAAITARLDADALVLDVGGAARPFPRADWILDLAPYEARGQLGWDGDRRQERFGPDRWVQRDICERTPWPFSDGQFDFAVCSHTLEDVRDPVWVASELARVARAGYVEVPSLREELTYGIQGPWVGWGHHHWLIREADRGLEFIFKHHVVTRPGSHLRAGSADGLTAEQRVIAHWWEGSLHVRERFLLTAEELDGFLAGCVARWSVPPPAARSLAALRDRVAGRIRPGH
ncbi:MAG TPA: class I SAM-dependent methyltransferase [Solirubrobacteraceae bacterium]|nr:class I SAM-dependent methyltransferase [Solirubrobacteraceae bacterium]